MSTRDRLRIAIQKSGRLSDASLDLLARCGLSFRRSRDKLFCFGETLAVDLLLVRDDDVPNMIADGVCDLGIVGRNVLDEQILSARAAGQQAAFRELRALGFGSGTLDIDALANRLQTEAPRACIGGKSRRQNGDGDSVRKPIAHVRCDLDRKPGFADAARTGQGAEPHAWLAQNPLDGRYSIVSSDQGG